MADRLAGQVAVVTGAGRGIGRAIALALAAEGAKVVVNDLGVDIDGSHPSHAPADKVVREISGRGGTAVANYHSVVSAEGAQQIIKTAVDDFGRIDILVNNAVILRNRMIFNLTEEDWDAVAGVSLKGYFLCTKYAAGLMRAQRSGRIVNMTSDAAIVGTTGAANYCAATGGVLGLTKAAAMELGRFGVTVNAVSPLADTRMLESVPDRSHEIMQRRGISGANLSRGSGTPDDVAPLVVFLCSDEASDLNGQTLSVTGGRVGLYRFPSITSVFHKAGNWTPDDVEALFKSQLANTIVNPAPAGAS